LNQKDAGKFFLRLFDLKTTDGCVTYPPQVKPPVPQLLELELVELEELEELEVVTEKDATFDIFFLVFVLAHFGQTGSLSASEKRRFISNSSPHLVQRNSYKGMAGYPLGLAG
jgi:hypothetical protein